MASLSKRLRDATKAAVNNLFERAKARLLGKYFNGPKIFFQVIRDFGVDNSLEGAFRHATMLQSGPGTPINQELIELKNDETESIVDALQSKTLKEALQAVKLGDSEKLKDIFVNATNHMDMIATTEVRSAQSYAESDSIAQVAASQGIEDPTLFEITSSLDNRTCKYCLAMYHCKSNPLIPRTWKMSQLKEGYFKPKEWDGNSMYRNCHPRCFSDDTEVLTDNGWKFFKDLVGSELILSVNPDTGNADWISIKEKVSYFYAGKMHSFKNHRMSLLTTPNHTHVVNYISKKPSEKHGLIADKKKILLKQVSELPKTQWNFIGTIPNWIGIRADNFTFGDEIFNSEDFLKLVGFYLSEGSLYHNKTNKPGSGWRISICQSEGKYRNEMAEVCKRLFKTVWVYKDKIIIPSKNMELINFFKQTGHASNKFIPKEIKGLCKEQIDIFLKAFCMGDGSVRKPRDWKGYIFSSEITYSTSSPKLSADLGELILKIGCKPSYYVQVPRTIQHKNGIFTQKYPQYLIRQNKKTNHIITYVDFKEVDYSGMVYDIELEKFHTLFVRKDGKTLLSGNCRHSMSLLIPGFGFNESGKVTYVGPNHDEYEVQKARGDT